MRSRYGIPSVRCCLSGLLSVAAAAGLTGCELRRHENVFILPDGLIGKIELILVEGAPVAFTTQGDTYTYVIPPSGVLCVASFDNFTAGWGNTVAVYADGTPVPPSTVESFDDRRFATLNQKWSTTRVHADNRTEYLSDPELLFFVGTSSEIESGARAWLALKPGFRRDECQPMSAPSSA